MEMDWTIKRNELESEFLQRDWFADSQNSAYKMDRSHAVIIASVSRVRFICVLEIKSWDHSPGRLPPCWQCWSGDGLLGWEKWKYVTDQMVRKIADPVDLCVFFAYWVWFGHHLIKTGPMESKNLQVSWEEHYWTNSPGKQDRILINSPYWQQNLSCTQNLSYTRLIEKWLIVTYNPK